MSPVEPTCQGARNGNCAVYPKARLWQIHGLPKWTPAGLQASAPFWEEHVRVPGWERLSFALTLGTR